MENSFQFNYLDRLFKTSPEISLNKASKFVILSDLHVGSRRRRDDFLKNSEMFMHLLKNYYLKNNYKIIELIISSIILLITNDFYFTESTAVFKSFSSKSRSGFGIKL